MSTTTCQLNERANRMKEGHKKSSSKHRDSIYAKLKHPAVTAVFINLEQNIYSIATVILGVCLLIFSYEKEGKRAKQISTRCENQLA